MQGTEDAFGVRGNCHSLVRYLRERQLSRSKHDRLFLFNQLAGCSILLHYFYPLFNCSCGERPSYFTIAEATLRILHVEHVCLSFEFPLLGCPHGLNATRASKTNAMQGTPLPTPSSKLSGNSA